MYASKHFSIRIYYQLWVIVHSRSSWDHRYLCLGLFSTVWAWLSSMTVPIMTHSIVFPLCGAKLTSVPHLEATSCWDRPHLWTYVWSAPQAQFWKIKMRHCDKYIMVVFLLFTLSLGGDKAFSWRHIMSIGNFNQMYTYIDYCWGCWQGNNGFSPARCADYRCSNHFLSGLNLFLSNLSLLGCRRRRRLVNFCLHRWWDGGINSHQSWGRHTPFQVIRWIGQ